MLSTFFIHRPIFATVLSLVIIVAGVTAVSSLPIASYPNMAPPTISVTAVYPGADAETLASTVASPIEQEVNGVEGMLYMSSTSAGDGTYSLRISFATGTDLDIASVQVQNRVAAAEPSLPQEVRQFGVKTEKRMPDFAQMISVTSNDPQLDDIFLSNWAALNLRDQLQRVDGVGSVQVFGAADYAMRVWLDPEKLQVRGLTASDVLNAIRDQNVQVAAGTIGQPPADAGTPFQFAVTAQGRLLDADEFGQITIRQTEDGRKLLLRDIARIELGAENYVVESKVDGNPASVLAIYQLPGANLVNVSDDVQALLEELRPTFPDGVDVAVTYDAADQVRASIKEIVTTLLIAAVLVILTVLVFLQDFRATIIPAVTIPVSLVGTFAVMLLLGFSLNTLTLFGLVLAIGIVVDDAIVVVENVARNLEETDLSPKEAAVKAMEEVTGPVIATTLVLLAVFVPTSFMSGMTGVMYNQFGLTIAAATIFSSVNALTLSPALCGVLLKRSSGKKNPLFRAFNTAIESSTAGYTKLVTQSVRKAAIALLLFAGLSLVGVFGYSSLPGGFVPDEDQGYLMAGVVLPDAASRERTRAVTAEVDQMVGETEGIKSFIQINGYSLIDGVANPNVASYIMTLEHWDDRDRTQPQILRELQGKLATVIDGFAFAFPTPPIPGLGTSGGFDMQLQDRAGVGVETLQNVAFNLAADANTQSNITGANSSFRANVPQLFVDVDREKVQQLGLRLSDVFGTLQTNLGSSYANDFNAFGRTYQVKVQADSPFRSTPSDILALRVRDADGNEIPMSAVATVEQRFGPSSINRFNLYPAASIKGSAAPGASSGEALDLMEQIAGQSLPTSMGFEWTGLSYQEKEASGGVLIIFALSMLLVFLTLAAQYESWTLPAAVLLAVPLGLLGVAAGCLARGFDNNVYTQIGVVLLIAMVSKNSILIIEFAREKRSEGLSPADAAIEAARLRFRPILMTAFSFVLGTAPLVVATGAGAGARTNLGTAVFMGLIVATIFGVIFTPAIYRVVQGTSERFGRRSNDEAEADVVPAAAEPA
ncbi:MAG: multidrug efflux RND transporter permease subunit [Planctomycetota bacterium]